MAIGDIHFVQRPDTHPAEDLKAAGPNRRSALVLCATLIGGLVPQLAMLRAQPGPADGRVAWVGDVLKRMQTIKPGMSREALLRVFTTEGGLSTGLQRTFVSRDCPYFKVDVQFKAVRRPDRDSQGRVTLREDPRDLIVEISRPYVALPSMD